MNNINDAQYRCVKIDKETGEVLPITYHLYKSTAMYDYKIMKDMDGVYDVEMKNENGEWVSFENEV